jgi:copper chaperone
MGLFKIPDMSCGHCEKAIIQELTKVSSEVKVVVDLKSKTITVENLSDDRVEFLLKELGYTPQKIK